MSDVNGQSLASGTKAKTSKTKRKIVIGMTGGIDSTIAAFLLKKQGHDCIGVAIDVNDEKVFSKPQFYSRCHVRDLSKVKSLCEKLDIAFFAVNARSEFYERVVSRYSASRVEGTFSRPCLDCNSMIMALLKEKMELLKADLIATGHYAKVYKGLISEEFAIHMATDLVHDQSYLLAHVPGNILEKLILPLSELSRSDVVELAKKYDLLSSIRNPEIANEKENGNCHSMCLSSRPLAKEIVEKTVMSSFLKIGPFMHKKTETSLGEHEGIHLFQVGDSSELNSPLAKELVVSEISYTGGIVFLDEQKNLFKEGCQVTLSSLSKDIDRTRPMEAYVKTHQAEDKPIAAVIFFRSNQSAYISFSKPVYGLNLGHHLTIYSGESSSSRAFATGVVLNMESNEYVSRVEKFREHTDVDFSSNENSGEEEKAKNENKSVREIFNF